MSSEQQMSEMDERLELLMGKLLDGELSPGEQDILAQWLDGNDRAQELLEQLRAVSASGRDAIAGALLDARASADEIFERAWRQKARASQGHVVRAHGYLRFAAGLAAGFLLGLLVHFFLVWPDTAAKTPTREGTLARDVVPDRPSILESVPTRDVPERVTRKVDWYSFTDETGGRWLVEGMREGIVKPAAYDGDL